MNNPFMALPSYVKESPKFSRFLELTNAYLMSGALELSLFKSAFLSQSKPRFVIDALSKQIGVDVELPFKNGVPDWDTYFERLFLGYRAKSFNTAFAGRMADFITGDPLSDVSSLVVVDFAVAKENKSPMSVVYSVLSMDENLTVDIIRDLLIPRVTGVNASLYYLQFGQDVFGYDIDEKLGLRIGPDHVNTVPITEAPYVLASATINSLGTGYRVNDIVTSPSGIQFQIKDLAEGAFLGIVDPTASFAVDPTTKEPVVVSGGSGSGMTISIVGTSRKGYFIRGFDNGSFVSITRKGQ